MKQLIYLKTVASDLRITSTDISPRENVSSFTYYVYLLIIQLEQSSSLSSVYRSPLLVLDRDRDPPQNLIKNGLAGCLHKPNSCNLSNIFGPSRLVLLHCIGAACRLVRGHSRTYMPQRLSVLRAILPVHIATQLANSVFFRDLGSSTNVLFRILSRSELTL